MDGAEGMDAEAAEVAVVGDFGGASGLIADCDEDRENVLEKGAPRWVSLSSVDGQSLQHV